MTPHGTGPKTSQQTRLGHVLAIASTTMLARNAVDRAHAADITASLPASAWEERSAGPGVHGQRYRRWA